jgi:hypothetical protein
MKCTVFIITKPIIRLPVLLLQSCHGVLREEPSSSTSKCNSKEPDQVFEHLVVRRYKQEDCSFIFYCALGEKEGEKQTVTETPWG